MSHKRAAEGQLSRDDDGEDRAEESFVTTPQIADATEMATRRVVKVRRPDGSSASSASATAPATTSATSGFFKDAATSAAGAATAPAKPAFNFGFNTSGSPAAPSSTFSFGNTTATTAKPSFGFPTAASSNSSTAATTATPSGFSFGLPNTASSSVASSGLSFGAKPEGSGSSSTTAPATTEESKKDSSSASGSSPVAFGFGAAPPASDGAAKKPAATFSFGLPTTAPASATAEAKDASSGEVKPLFGGSFNFGSAVNSFVAARNKMQEEAKQAKVDGGEAEKKDGEATAEASANAASNGKEEDADADDKPDPAGFGSEIVEPTERDVLATAPSKVYLFVKGEDGKAGSWAERGAGDAKLISQVKADDAAAHIYRLLVRGGYSLNATIKKNTFSLSKTEAKHLILLVGTVDGPQTYLLKFTGPSAEANTTKFSESLKKVIEEVSKEE